jgi:DNA-binding CsgD family transcriptional regulator
MLLTYLLSQVNNKKVKSMKEKIIKLRKGGKSYNEIVEALGCSKANVSYHCKREGVNGRVDGIDYIYNNIDLINEIKEFYKKNTLQETAKNFGISTSTVKTYVDKKLKILTDEEKRRRNYERIKSRRQKIKEKAVEYKGGCCESCGYKKCLWALDFHHTKEGEKDFGIAKYSTFSWEKIKKELDKCIMLCANCHREVHYEIFLNKCSYSSIE